MDFDESETKKNLLTALQGFPRNWTKYGVNDELISDTQRYKCIGNAVTTNVITHIFNNWDLYEN